MPPSSPARQRQPTPLTLFASATPSQKAAVLSNSVTSLSPTANGGRCNARGPTPSPTVTTSSSNSKEAFFLGKRVDAPADLVQQHNTTKVPSYHCSDDEEEADMLLGELLFGTDARRGADSSFPLCPPPVSPPASLDSIATVFGAAATAGGADPPCLRRSRPPLHLTQTTLDLGQAEPTIATRCPLCHMLYAAEDDEDAALHRRFCRGEERLRRRERGPLDASSAFATAFRSRRARTEAAAKPLAPRTHTAALAVGMLEALSGAQTGHSLSPLLSNTTRTSQRGGQRRREGWARGVGKAIHATTNTPTDVVDATVCSCRSVFCPLLSSSSPLEVFHLVFNACRLTDRKGAGMALRLLELLDFTPVVVRAAAACTNSPPTALSSLSCKNTPVVPTVKDSATPTVHMVCVVDAVLRQLLCAVVGEPRRREQDPELCVERRADGTTVCSTRRHFTHGDVAGLWLCSPAELSTAQETWAKRTAAPFTPTRQTLERFFGTHAFSSAPSSTQTHAAHTIDKAQERCQEAAGVALHTLAQRLVYGSSLCPAQHLSYAQAAVAAAVAYVGADFIGESLAAVSSCYPAGAILAPREDVAEPQPLYTHDDNSDSSSDSDNADEGDTVVSRE
nr:unnamed protein product [Leishmania braziliensis]